MSGRNSTNPGDIEPALETGYCLGCGYALRGSPSGACPECGRPFAWEEAGSFSPSRTHQALDRWLRPHWGLNLLFVGLVLWMWVAFSVPGSYFGLFMLGVLAGLIIGGFWLIWLISTIVFLSLQRDYRITQRGYARAWLAAPIIVAIGILVIALSLPMRVAFWLSLPSMNAVAQQIVSTPGAPLPQRDWIGVYPAKQIESFATGMRFKIDGAGFLDHAGFAYSPHGPPPNLGGEDRYEHFAGPWYTWIESW